MTAGLLLALGLVLQTRGPITTTVTPDRVAPGEMFEVRIEVEFDGASPDITLEPIPAGLEVRGVGPLSHRPVNRYPTGVTTVFTKTFSIVSRVEGHFSILARVRANGRLFAEDRVVVEVGIPGRATAADLANEPRLTLSITPRKVWIGQAVVLRADAMLPREMRSRLTRPAAYEPPLAPGFWVVDLPNALTVRLERIDGKIFEVQTYRRAYVPILPGRHALPPARLGYEIRIGLAQPPEMHAVYSDSVVIDVLPLPVDGQPASFTGAVGHYTLDAALEPASVAVGEASTVRVVVRGSGNIKALRAPAR